MWRFSCCADCNGAPKFSPSRRQPWREGTGAGDLFGPDNRLAKLRATYYQAGLVMPFARSKTSLGVSFKF
jgi:hypothetical protein